MPPCHGITFVPFFQICGALVSDYSLVVCRRADFFSPFSVYEVNSNQLHGVTLLDLRFYNTEARDKMNVLR